MNLDSPYYSIKQFLNYWDSVRFVTLTVLKAFKDEHLDYKYREGACTLAEIFHHIGGHQYFVSRGVLLERWTALPGDPDIDWDDHKLKITENTLKLYDWLEYTQNQMKKWFEEAKYQSLIKTRTDNPWHEDIKGWRLLYHPFQDEIHHRGQIYLIAGLLNVKLPEVYIEEYSLEWNKFKDD